MNATLNLKVIRVDGLQWDRSLHSKIPNLCVEVGLGRILRKTRTIKDKSRIWNETLSFPTADLSTTISIKVLHKSSILFRDGTCIGSVNVELVELSGKCINGPAHLPLDVPVGKDYGKPIVVVHLLNATITSADLRPDVNTAIESVRGLDHAADSHDVVEQGLSMLNEEKDLGESILALVERTGVLVNIIDKLSTLHPYVNAAWQLASALHKAISHQIETDQKLVRVFHAMEDAFNFVTDADSLPDKTRRLKQTVERLLQQTIECCRFVLHYTNRKFASRMLQMSRPRIDEFTERFLDLKRALDLDIGLHTAFVSARISDDVEDIYFRELLEPFNMNAFNRNTCLEDTRVEVLNEIMDWVLSDTTQNILWLHGVAGSGKSTIATTIAEYCRDMSRLGAFIFFRRADGTDGQLVSLFRTLAFRLAMFDSSIASHVKATVKKSDHITEAVAEVQFKRLLLEPLVAARDEIQGPVVIVLDALDECGTPDARWKLMSLLEKAFGKLPPSFRFLITSRPEDDINKVLSNKPSSVYELNLDSGSADSRRDVLRYIDYEMTKVINDAKVIIPSNWLWGENMERLADTSEGLFIWASTAIKLVSESPSKFRKLNELVNTSNRLKGLDQLYEEVLRTSGVIATDDPSSVVRFQQILGLVLLSWVPLSDVTIDAILGLPPEEPSHEILSRLRSVLVFTRGDPIHLLHTSFADYLMSSSCPKNCPIHHDTSNCLSSPWFIDIATQNSIIAERCFATMTIGLRFNICNLESSFVYNDEVAGIDDRIKDKIPLQLWYVCMYWAHHLINAPHSRELLNGLTAFAHTQLLYWFEVIGLLGLVRSIASRALLGAAAWSEVHDSDISSFLKDASGLASTFAIPLTESTPHIYISMLPLMKNDSKVAAHYSKQTSRLAVVERIGVKRPPLWLKVLEGHSECVWSVAFSPDGKRVASGSDDGTARIWDIESGEVICVLFERNRAAVTSVAFSPDGRRIASGLWDNTVTIWDVESREFIPGSFKGHTKVVWAIAFSPGGTHVASGSADKTIRVWNVESASAIHVFEGHTDAVWSVTFSSDGKRIVSGSEDETIRVWDAMTGQAIGDPFTGHTREVRCVASSLDGKCIVSGSDDHTVRVWDMESGKVVAGPFWHSNFVNSVAISADGKRIVSGSADDTIVVWDVESGDIASGPFAGHANSVLSVAFSPNGSRIVSGSLDKTVRLWDASIGKIVSDSSTRHTEAIVSVAFSPDSKRIASGSSDKTTRLWDASTGKVTSASFKGHGNVVFSVAFSPDGERLVSGSGDKSVFVWDVRGDEMTFKPLKGHRNPVNSVTFSPDGTRIVSGSYDGTIIIWNAEDGNMIARLGQEHKTEIWTVAFSPDGTLIASASVDNDVIIWNAESGKCVFGPFKAPKDSTYPYFAPLAYSSDGTCIASRSSNNDIIIRDVQGGQIVSGPLTGHSDTVRSVAFSPTRAYLVSGSYDRTVIIWDASNGNVVSGPYEGHTSGITCIAFSTDGLRVVSCSFDATIRVWDASGQEGILLTTRRTPDNAVTSCSPVQGANEGLARWKLSDNGWVLGSQGELLLWLPPDIRPTLWRPQNTAVFSCEFSTKLNFKDVAHGQCWQECFNPI